MKKRMKILVAALAVVMVLGVCSTAFAAPYAWGGGNFVTVKSGSNNSYVRAAQNICKYNIGSSISVDGAFGNGTKEAVIAYQKKYGLTSDGIVGADTWANMQQRLEGYNSTPRKTNGTFKIWQYTKGAYTSTAFFRRETSQGNRWDTYRAVAGSDPGTWYTVKN